MTGFGMKGAQSREDVFNLSHETNASISRNCWESEHNLPVLVPSAVQCANRVIDKGFRYAIESFAFRYQAYKDGVPDEDIFRQTA